MSITKEKHEEIVNDCVTSLLATVDANIKSLSDKTMLALKESGDNPVKSGFAMGVMFTEFIQGMNDAKELFQRDIHESIQEEEYKLQQLEEGEDLPF